MIALATYIVATVIVVVAAIAFLYVAGCVFLIALGLVARMFEGRQ